MHHQGRPNIYLFNFSHIVRKTRRKCSYFSNVQPCTITYKLDKVKVKVSHSLIAIGAVGVRVPLYLGHS